MIRTVLFDFADVYVVGMFGVEYAIARVVGREPRDVWQHLNGTKLDDLFRGLSSEDHYWDDVIRDGKYTHEIDDQPTAEFLKAAMRRNFRKINGTEDIIRRLQIAGYSLGLISDHCKEWIEYCEGRFPIMEFFPEICYSFDTGHTKRDGGHNFRLAMERLNADPVTTLYVDDSLRNLHVAFANAGIENLHHFVDAKSLESDLRENLGII